MLARGSSQVPKAFLRKQPKWLRIGKPLFFESNLSRETWERYQCEMCPGVGYRVGIIGGSQHDKNYHNKLLSQFQN